MTKYLFIAQDISNKILKTGELKSSQMLKTEQELCEEYGVSKMTIKKALDILVSEGLICKQRGVGTFVKSRSDSTVSKLKETYGVLDLLGFTASHKNKNVSTKVLTYDIIRPSIQVAQQLNMSTDSFVYHIIRVRYIDKKPYVYENVYMPIDVIPGLKKEHAEESIYSYIENGLGYTVQSSHVSITSRICPENIAPYLALSSQDPVSVVEQIAYLNNGQIFEYSICTHRYDTFVFHTVMVRNN